MEKSDNKKRLVDTVVITNSKKVLAYMITLQDKAFKNDELILTQYTGEVLKTKFGKHNFTVNGSRRLKVWVFNFEGQVFEVYTNKNYGTQIVVNLKYEDIRNGEYDKILMSFLDDLYFDVNN